MKRTFTRTLAFMICISVCLFLPSCSVVLNSHPHDYQVIADARYIRSKADCNNPASYYPVCFCGKIGNNPINFGQPYHSYVDRFCTECGLEYYTPGLSFVEQDEGIVSLTDAKSITETDVVIPGSFYGMKVISIGNRAFANVYLKKVTIYDGITSIGEEAFYDCRDLKEINIPSTVNTIETRAFYGCVNLEKISLPSGITVIPAWAFTCCRSLESVTISKSVTLIEHCAFSAAESLRHIYYEGTIEEWNSIQKTNRWDELTPNYTVYCSDGSVTKE